VASISMSNLCSIHQGLNISISSGEGWSNGQEKAEMFPKCKMALTAISQFVATSFPYQAFHMKFTPTNSVCEMW